METFKPTSTIPQLTKVEKAFLREMLTKALIHRAEPYGYWNDEEDDNEEDRASYARYLAEFDAECAAVLAAYPELSFLEPKCLHWHWDQFCNDISCSHWMDPWMTNSFRFYLLGYLAQGGASEKEHIANGGVFSAVYLEFGVRLWSWLCEGMPLVQALAKLPFAKPLEVEYLGAGIDNESLFVDAQEPSAPAPRKTGFARVMSFLIGR